MFLFGAELWLAFARPTERDSWGWVAPGGWWHSGRQEEDEESVLWSEVRAAFAGWEVSRGVGRCVEQGTCVGFGVKSKSRPPVRVN